MLRHVRIALMGVILLSGLAGHAQNEASISIGVNPQLSEGAQALEFGNYDEGIRLTELGLKSTVRPRDRIGALSNLCAGYVGSREYAEALRYCNRSLRLDDRNWHAYNNRSLAYLGMGDLKNAQRDVEKGLAINPQSSSLKTVEKMVQTAANPPVETPAAADSPESSD